ncbi:MAG: IS3 family transposase, partial [Gemmatimonadales bacterium]|nr:IS3 family transposase [Gemmatimonadales bacterium]
MPDDEAPLTARIVALASEYGRYGYRRVTARLQREGWRVNHKRVERSWRQQGLTVPPPPPGRGRLWLTDGSCLRRRPQHRHHVWSYDFVADRTHSGRPIRMVTVLDEYTREGLALEVPRTRTAQDVLDVLRDLFVERGAPEDIRSDHGPACTATVVRDWLASVAVKTRFIEPGSPWENGYNERFNGTLRDELLAREIFSTLREAQVLVAAWRKQYH